MILYRGTNQIVREIDLNKGRLRTDFGKGYYLGSNLGVAREWAKSRAAFSGTPIVMRYNLDFDVFNDENVNPCKFDNPTVEWLNFVRDNRRKNAKGLNSAEPRHNFGIVFGAIANDKVNFVVDDYIKGLLTVEEAIKKVRALQSVFQVSIHTPTALIYLADSNVEYQKLLDTETWSEWYQL
jgi:hypothetical protein